MVHCQCSNCYGKDRYLSSSQRIQRNTDDLFRAWRNAVQQFPPNSSISTIAKMKAIFVSTALSPSVPPLSPFASRVLLDLYNSLGLLAFVDDVETLWDSQSRHCCELLSCVIAHSSLLDVGSVITVLHEMCTTSQWSQSMAQLVLHCLCSRLSKPHNSLSELSKSRLETVVRCLQPHVEDQPVPVVHCVGWLVLNEIPSLQLCCRTWRLHVCGRCGKGRTACAYCDVLLEAPRELGGRCGWRPPQSKHCCGCGVEHMDRRKQGCLCEAGDYPMSFDYSISSSSDDEDDLVFEMKRIKLEVMEEMKHQPLFGYDVWLNVFSFLSLKDFSQMASVNHQFLEISQTDGVWKERFSSLFTHYRCNHRKNYVHNYFRMAKRRIQSLRHLKGREIICQFCGCIRRFDSREEYQKHVMESHHS